MDKIILLRELFKQHNVNGFFIPMNDVFNCEYVPEHNQRLKYATGFTGSAANTIITDTKNCFETDGRYELAASTEIDSNIFDVVITPKKTIYNWLEENFEKGKTLGFDGSLISRRNFLNLQKLAEKDNFKIKDVPNLVDSIWKDRPTENIKPAFILDEKYSGKNFKEKIDDVLNKIDADYCLLTLPESVCWLLNIRGYDLAFTPFLLCFAIIDKAKKKVALFADLRKIPEEFKTHFGDDVEFKDLNIFEDCLKKISGKKIQLDPSNSANRFYDILKETGAEIIEANDPTLLPKARKNQTEIDVIRSAHIQDGAALVKFFYWLENNLNTTEITEISASDKLEEIRKQNKNFFSLSFNTIAGFASNGAIIHYHADEKSNKLLKQDNILLLDSGAQYLGATTDVTRTITLGKPTDEQIKNNTLVLKGHIGVAKAIFPEGTAGNQLDILARKALWEEQKDYAHGTGHGVGAFLNVHEGPQGISRINTTPLAEGMVISNEPGFYKNGEYGIRIESLVVVKKLSDKFLAFETFTKAPIDKKLIDANLLDDNEKAWLNDYHKTVYDELSEFLNDSEKAWLKNATSEIK